MSSSGEEQDGQHTPRTKALIHDVLRRAKKQAEGLDADLQTTNERLGHLEIAQIATSTRLQTLEQSVRSVDTSLAALLRRFDGFMAAGGSNNQRPDDIREEHANEDMFDENDYAGDTEDDRDRQRLRQNRRFSLCY